MTRVHVEEGGVEDEQQRVLTSASVYAIINNISMARDRDHATSGKNTKILTTIGLRSIKVICIIHGMGRGRTTKHRLQPPQDVPGNNVNAPSTLSSVEYLEREMDLKQPVPGAEVVIGKPPNGIDCLERERGRGLARSTGVLNLGVSAGAYKDGTTGGEVTQIREKTDRGSSYKMDRTFALSDEDATHIPDTQVPERGLTVPTSLTVERDESVSGKKSSYVDTDYLGVYEPAVCSHWIRNPRRVGASFETCLTFLLEVLSRFVFARGAKKIN